MSRNQLRKPSAAVLLFVDTLGRGSDRLEQPNRLAGGRVCDGCKWPGRCRTDSICWAAEKADIAAERAARPAGPWTRERVVEAYHDHVARHGQIPTNDEWSRGTERHPSSHTAKGLFGSWAAALAAAGYQPRGRYGHDPNTYPNRMTPDGGLYDHDDD